LFTFCLYIEDFIYHHVTFEWGQCSATTITTFVLKYVCSYVLSPFCNENVLSIAKLPIQTN